MNESLRSLRLASVLALAALSGCMLMDVPKQQALMKDFCLLAGDVTATRQQGDSLVVVLIRQSDPSSSAAELAQWQVADHYVVQEDAHWRFRFPAGEYRVAAFDDANSNLVYEPGEAFVGADPAKTFRCEHGEQWQSIALVVPDLPSRQVDRTIDVAALQNQSSVEQLNKTIGQLTAVGELATLDDPRFSLDNAEDSLWRPYDFIVKSHPGVYFLEPYDPKKTPVLFVHGINGSPLNFGYLIEQLDRTHFQPWVYSYPSGVYLSSIADHLTQVMMKLEAQYRIERFVVVAHSMGGLVARGFLLRHAKASQVPTPLFATLSTPWAGHAAAESGVKHAPVVVDVWRDMAPGSTYLQSLFAEPLPPPTRHVLLFTFARNSASFGASDDHTVTVASQLAQSAQQQATQIHGFDATHEGVLRDADVARILNRLLTTAY